MHWRAENVALPIPEVRFRRAPAAAVAILPLLVVFLVLQRYIVAGAERSGIDD